MHGLDAPLALLEKEGGSKEINTSTILEAKLVLANAYVHIPGIRRSACNHRQEDERILRE